MSDTLEMSYLEQKIACDTNCPECRAGVCQANMRGWRDCPTHIGTGRDPIPWAELFSEWRKE